MSGEMIAIVAVGVALAGCGKTWRGWNRGWMIPLNFGDKP